MIWDVGEDEGKDRNGDGNRNNEGNELVLKFCKNSINNITVFSH